MLGIVALVLITVYLINGELKFTAVSTVRATDLKRKTTLNVNKTIQWMLGMAGEEKCLPVEHARRDAKIDPRECKVQKLQKDIQEKHNQLLQKLLDKENSDSKNTNSGYICHLRIVN